MVETEVETRKRAFKAALAYAGMTVEQWCAEKEITPGHLYQVLRADRESASLLAEVDAFIAAYTPSSAA